MCIFRQRSKIIGWFLFVQVLLNSCIIDEFKFNDVQLKDDWNLEIISPVLYGKWELKDVIYGWDSVDFQGVEQTTVLQFSKDSFLNFPRHLIYEPETIIDSFNFYVDGDDYLQNADLEFSLLNACPMPFVLQLTFYSSIKTNGISSIVSVPVFDAGKLIQSGVDPVFTKHTVTLNNEQLIGFKESDRVRFTASFARPVSETGLDTLQANYSIEFSIVLNGIINRNYD